MICPKCNRHVNHGMNFCSSCGNPMNATSTTQPHQPGSFTMPPTQNNPFTPQSGSIPPPQPYTPQSSSTPPPQPYAPQPAYTPPYAPYAAGQAFAPRKKTSPLIFVAIAAVVTAIAVAVVLFVIPLLRQTPLLPVQRALTNFSEEATQRVESSPFQAFMLMSDIYQEGAGTLTLNFDYRSGTIWNPDVSGNFTLASDSRNLEWAASGEVRVMGMPFDISAVMNRERLAVQSNIIDRDNFYGITFATFAQDMTQFGRMIGMSEWEINEIIDFVSMIEQTMDFEAAIADDWGEVYTDIITAFFLNLEFTTENTEIRVGGEDISANRVEFVITQHDIIRLMHELVDAFENDPTMRNFFESNAMMMGMPSFNQMMREMRDELREFENLFDGIIRISLYIGRGDRLKQARLDADMLFDGDASTFGMLLDLGSSVNDSWQITVDWSDRFGHDSFSASWDFQQVGQNYVNSISFFDGWDHITLESAWNPNNGRFDLSFSDGWVRESFGGNFNVLGDGGFSLQLDRIDIDWNDTLDLGMTMSPGANIPSVDFINIDRWDLSLLELIERSILGMIW